jgi:pilus assembly protein CpaF
MAAPRENAMEMAARRAADADRVWPLVKRMLRIAQEDEQLNRVTSQFALTRDKSVDLRQFTEMQRLMWPIAASMPDFAMLREAQLTTIAELAYDELLGISVVGPFWRDDEVTEILIDAWDSITIERNGALHRTPLRFVDLNHAKDVARSLAQKVSDRALNPANPLVTAELPGARVTFAIDRVVKSGISVSLRKFPPLMRMANLLERGALSEEMRDFLADAVTARANVLVSGGTGTGKTTFINALSESIPDTERVITIEDAYELALRNTHWVAMQTKEASSADDEVHIDLSQLLRNTLRMRPDRIVVGEIREPAGATVMLNAANTGHDGTMTTIHAQSADRALNFRLVGLIRTGANMPSEVAALEVASAIDLVVQVKREKGVRFVSEIITCDPEDVDGAIITPHVIFRGALVPTVEQADDGTTKVVHRPRFEHVGPLPASNALALKMLSEGVGERWVADTGTVAAPASLAPAPIPVPFGPPAAALSNEHAPQQGGHETPADTGAAVHEDTDVSDADVVHQHPVPEPASGADAVISHSGDRSAGERADNATTSDSDDVADVQASLADGLASLFAEAISVIEIDELPEDHS